LQQSALSLWGLLWGSEAVRGCSRDLPTPNPTASRHRPISDRELKALLAVGATDKGVGEGLTFVASDTSARAVKASWILRFRLNGRSKEKVLGRYPELPLKEARDLARRDRAQIERGIDVAAAKQAAKSLTLEASTVRRLGELWFDRYIKPRYKYPEVVERVLRRHVNPVLGALAPADVQPAHIDQALRRIVAAGAPTVANDALRYMYRMFKMAVRNHWVERNPAADFELVDAGGEERSRDRWLRIDELRQLAGAMRTTPSLVARTSWRCGCCSRCACGRWSCCPRAGRRST
jgi:Arm DNA-binding domain